uniref:Uncharacterized protein n=1 Tax=Anguilla anguilla TaxID=7936 RepID=A0A0E9QCU2_ANGAN
MRQIRVEIKTYTAVDLQEQGWF